MLKRIHNTKIKNTTKRIERYNPNSNLGSRINEISNKKATKYLTKIITNLIKEKEKLLRRNLRTLSYFMIKPGIIIAKWEKKSSPPTSIIRIESLSSPISLLRPPEEPFGKFLEDWDIIREVVVRNTTLEFIRWINHQKNQKIKIRNIDI